MKSVVSYRRQSVHGLRETRNGGDATGNGGGGISDGDVELFDQLLVSAVVKRRGFGRFGVLNVVLDVLQNADMGTANVDNRYALDSEASNNASDNGQRASGVSLKHALNSREPTNWLKRRELGLGRSIPPPPPSPPPSLPLTTTTPSSSFSLLLPPR
ncbi:hypothetical protein V1477_012831 [Vespula maculifrons]|uniref:Uncharacterized protein n=1 Tax=Vespula maculifrons TaxID=7453 RepID=A0ABD2BU75_VESMC